MTLDWIEYAAFIPAVLFKTSSRRRHLCYDNLKAEQYTYLEISFIICSFSVVIIRMTFWRFGVIYHKLVDLH